MNKSHLFVFPTANLGGAERVMFNIIYYLLENNNNVTVVIMSRGEQQGWEDIKNHKNINFIVKEYKSEKKSILNVTSELVTLDKKNKYDFVVSSHTHVNALISFMKKIGFFKRANIVSRESTFIFERFTGIKRYIFYRMYKDMYGGQDLVVCQTERMKTSLIQNLGFMPTKKIEVIPNPVNISYIARQLNQDDLDKKPFEQLIVACGRLIELKKFDWLIKAFSHIAEEFPKAGIVIIGDGPERENLMNLTKRLGVESRVIFTGKIGNPIQWFNKADVGIISSEIEGFPNVLIEMMASGTKQVITTPCTDGVNNIPYITVTESCSRQALQKSLMEQLKYPIDNSKNNRKYIEEYRSVKAFWNKVQEYSVSNS